jgi:hypothetical protein
MSLQRTIRTRILEICIDEKMNLRVVTNLEVTLCMDENSDLLADPHILNKWRNYFFQLLNGSVMLGR